jgi:hypothetical protein
MAQRQHLLINLLINLSMRSEDIKGSTDFIGSKDPVSESGRGILEGKNDIFLVGKNRDLDQDPFIFKWI